MVYGDVINNGWHKILPKKAKYTIKDVDKVYTQLFMDGKHVSEKECFFIVKCTAAYYDASTSKTLDSGYDSWKLSKML